ncbi:MAG: RNA-binding S4 domain-containing protein [Betaproteobacteria bacterium]|nr:RNA-binding S4 domain-containing protein [Betaproteobacteria bacterium]
MQAIDYRIITEYIELNQLLKICGLAESGGAGGALVSEGNVKVDGQNELRKRCKIRPGQVVQLGDVRITVQGSTAEEMAAHAEARVVNARAKAEKKRQQAAAKPKAAAPWGQKTGTGGAKPNPKGRPKSGASTSSKSGETAQLQEKKRGNVFAANAEAHRRRRDRGTGN